MSFIPYVKYVLAPNTRFERDHEIFFGPKGKIAKGEPLINYGWGHGGLKQFVSAYYGAARNTTEQFESYYEELKKYRGNLLERMSSDDLLEFPLRGLITARIHQKMFIPILVVDFTAIRFKYCESCVRRWEGLSLPTRIDQLLANDKLSRKISRMRCTRMACNQLCGNYKNCVLNYTSLEEDPETEEKILSCLSALIKLLRLGIEPGKRFECREIEPDDENPRGVGPLRPDSRCFERPVRFDFQPIRRKHIDPETWKGIQDQRIDRGAHHIIDLIPSSLLPDIYEAQVKRTEVDAPLEATGVLQKFMQIADIRFEIKIDLSYACSICGQEHTLSRVPISAMFKTDQAYTQEAGFGRMLWKLLWREFPEGMCENYPRNCHVNNSPILKREMKVSVLAEDEKNNRDYDYAVNLEPLTGKLGWLLFSLTTGLWKKGGFHDVASETAKYLEYWKEMLVEIPSNLENVKSIWYVVVPSTEEQFFDDTAPKGISTMNTLINTISEGDTQQIFHPVAVFNSTPRKGEARHELRRLANERYFQETKVYPVVEALLQGVKSD